VGLVHDDEPVEHPKLIEAFNRGLKVLDDGKYRLEFGTDIWAYRQNHPEETVIFNRASG